jgi:23S rRNA pseudouridine1911/1915/1917 synthase
VNASSVIKLSSPATKEFWPIPVLFEDESLLAIDKPAGLLSSPDRYDPDRPNLMRLLHDGIREGKPWAAERKLEYLMNAHRLDLETTGIILLAKTKPVLVALANLFGTDKPVKKYSALVRGVPPNASFAVDAPICPHPTRLGEMRIAPLKAKDGKHAKTLFTVREAFRHCALVTCQPVTGRTHQIRVHLKYTGHPIFGDRVYGGRPLLLSSLKPDYRLKHGAVERPLISRTALHAEELTLPHPLTGATVHITAPWPREFAVAVKFLRRYSATAS